MSAFKALHKLAPALLAVLAVMGAAASPALAETEAHPFLFSFGSFTNPNGIAVEESTGDVYVADIGTDTVSKFDASGNPVGFTCGPECEAYVKGNELTGSPTGPFSFPEVSATPAAIAIDNSSDPSDPSRGDLYVMDAGHSAIDKFSPNGAYLYQITGPFEGELSGFALTANGALRVSSGGQIALSEFDNSTVNSFIRHLRAPPSSADPEESKYTLSAATEHSFAGGPTGSDYALLHECGCVLKLGLGGASAWVVPLGLVDSGPGDVAMAVDPVTGHLYVDAQSSVAEFDTGGVDGLDLSQKPSKASGRPRRLDRASPRWASRVSRGSRAGSPSTARAGRSMSQTRRTGRCMCSRVLRRLRRWARRPASPRRAPGCRAAWTRVVSLSRRASSNTKRKRRNHRTMITQRLSAFSITANSARRRRDRLGRA